MTRGQGDKVEYVQVLRMCAPGGAEPIIEIRWLGSRLRWYSRFLWRLLGVRVLTDATDWPLPDIDLDEGD